MGMLWTCVEERCWIYWEMELSGKRKREGSKNGFMNVVRKAMKAGGRTVEDAIDFKIQKWMILCGDH